MLAGRGSGSGRGWAAEELRKIEGIEILAEPQLSIVAFRLVRPGVDLNAMNHDLMDRINARKRVMYRHGPRYDIRDPHLRGLAAHASRSHADVPRRHPRRDKGNLE
jgi:glutamate/tyrosine decarboxylase-like PLP-dependent enzyme